MRIEPDIWLSNILGRPSFNVSLADEPSSDAAIFREHVAQQPGALYMARAATRDLRAVHFLQDLGFRVIDVNITFRRSNASLARLLIPQGIEVHQAQPSDHEHLLRIAETAFVMSRFHLDPKISEQVAAHIKRTWLENCLLGKRGDWVLVARRDGKPVGFLAALLSTREDGQIAIIDLIAVDPNHQRCGVGDALVAAFVEHYRGRVVALEVGTQVANIGSARLYEKWGFALHRSQFVLHLHVDGA